MPTCNWPFHFCAVLGMTAADALMQLRHKAHDEFPPDNPMMPFVLPQILAAISAAENLGCVDLPLQCQGLKTALDHANAGNWGDVVVELEQLGDPGDLLVSSTPSRPTGPCDFTRLPHRVQRALYELASHLGRRHSRASSDEFRDQFWSCLMDYAKEFSKP